MSVCPGNFWKVYIVKGIKQKKEGPSVHCYKYEACLRSNRSAGHGLLRN